MTLRVACLPFVTLVLRRSGLSRNHGKGIPSVSLPHLSLPFGVSSTAAGLWASSGPREDVGCPFGPPVCRPHDHPRGLVPKSLSLLSPVCDSAARSIVRTNARTSCPVVRLQRHSQGTTLLSFPECELLRGSGLQPDTGNGNLCKKFYLFVF